MKRFGFTLAEVLISMTIVGVISALTLPTFLANYQTTTSQTSRDVAVSNLEKALVAMILKEDVADLFETKAWRALDGTALNSTTDDAKRRAFLTPFGKTMAITKYITKADEGTIGLDGASFLAKNGIIYNIKISNPSSDPNAKAANASNPNGYTLYAVAGDLIVDANGTKKPNATGKDRFEFAIGSDGTIYSKSSGDYVNFYKK